MEPSQPGFSVPGSEERERLLQNLAAWLDRAMEDEAPPAGVPASLLEALDTGAPLPPLDSPENGSDLFSLWSAMTALTQEVRLQGRHFQQLRETLVQNEQNSVPAPASAAEVPPAQPNRREIDAMLDLRDRLERAVASAHAAAEELAPARFPLLARWLGIGKTFARHARELAASLAQGNSLILDQLDEALVACRVSRIACLNRPFDPRTMTAAAVALDDTVAEGTVVEIFRNGYEWNGEVYRLAQVKVARKKEGNAE